jgi:hypothetical protein
VLGHLALRGASELETLSVLAEGELLHLGNVQLDIVAALDKALLEPAGNEVAFQVTTRSTGASTSLRFVRP